MFTQGRWHRDDGFVKCDGMVICDPHCDGGPDDPDEREDNTSLIAGAPELYRAANDIDFWLSCEFPLRALGRKDEQKRIRLLRALRAALIAIDGRGASDPKGHGPRADVSSCYRHD